MRRLWSTSPWWKARILHLIKEKKKRRSEKKNKDLLDTVYFTYPYAQLASNLVLQWLFWPYQLRWPWCPAFNFVQLPLVASYQLWQLLPRSVLPPVTAFTLRSNNFRLLGPTDSNGLITFPRSITSSVPSLPCFLVVSYFALDSWLRLTLHSLRLQSRVTPSFTSR